MSDQSAIEWTDATWNPVTGCDRVSPGCAHCYALTLAKRLKGMGNPRYQRDGDPKSSGPGFGVTLHPDVLEKPLRWKKPRRVFVNSMSDLFHEEISFQYIAEVFNVMASAECESHTFQVLTKRPERMVEFFHWLGEYAPGDCPVSVAMEVCGNPGPNIWLGVSIENRRFVHRADLLRQTPAAVRFISAEPLLGPLVAQRRSATDGVWHTWEWNDGYTGPDLDLTGIDWLIVGGESGPGHRPIDPTWVRRLRMRARNVRGHADRRPTAFFFKQWGGARSKSNGRELDGREWSEFPQMAEAPA